MFGFAGIFNVPKHMQIIEESNFLFLMYNSRSADTPLQCRPPKSNATFIYIPDKKKETHTVTFSR